MAPDIEAATRLLKEGKIWEAVVPYFDVYNSRQVIDTFVPSPTASSVKSSHSVNMRHSHKRRKLSG